MFKKYFWLLFLLLSLALRTVFQARPDWTEQVYSRGIFHGVRFLIDYLIGWLPFPITYLIFGFLLWQGVRGIRYLFFKKTVSIRQRLLVSARRLAMFLCGVVALFHWMWAYNYSRIPIEEQLAIPEISLSKEDLKQALEAQTRVVLALRMQIQPDTGQAIVSEYPNKELESAVRREVVELLEQLGYSTPGRPRGRQPFWDGFLLRFGAAGIYNPFSGECNIDRGLHFLTKANNLAHEFCHGYGFGDEGTCNFLAYLALAKSREPLLRYSSELDFWRELASTYRQINSEEYAAFRAALPGGFIADLENIYRKHEQYPEFFASFRYQVYDNYLKTQGISEGMANYGKVIPLVLAFRIRDEE